MRKISLLLVGILMLVILAACGDDGKNEDSAEGGTKNATELDFWTFAGTHADFFESAANRWNKEFPDKAIKLKTETYPFDQMHTNLLLALQSGSGAPDLVDIEIAKFPNYLKGEIQLEPLNDLIDPIKENFITQRLDIYAKDGKYYGAPTHLGATVVYYNTEIMDEAGVDIDSIKTWDDYVEAGKQVKEKTNKPMTTISENWYGIWPFITQRDSDFFDDDGELTLDNKTNIETLQFIDDMVNKHEIAILTPGGGNHSEEYYGFMNDGGAASVIIPMFYMKDFTEYMPDLKGKVQIRPMPLWSDSDKRTVGMGGTGTAVTNQSENVDLAKEFLAYAKLSESGNIQLWKELGFDPPRWDVWDSPEIREDNAFYDYFHDDIFDILLEIRDEVGSVNITEFTPDVLEGLETTIMHNVLREQKQTAEEALKQASESVRLKMESTK